MTAITAIDRKTCKLVQDGAIKALQDYAKSLGLSVTFAGGSYTDRDFTMKAKFALTGNAAEDAGKSHFEQHCRLFGLQAGDYKRRMTYGGQKLELVALDLKRHKYPLVFQPIGGGQRRVFTTDAIKMLDPTKA